MMMFLHLLRYKYISKHHGCARENHEVICSYVRFPLFNYLRCTRSTQDVSGENLKGVNYFSSIVLFADDNCGAWRGYCSFFRGGQVSCISLGCSIGHPEEFSHYWSPTFPAHFRSLHVKQNAQK